MKLKRILAMSFAASALVFTSCSNDELEGGDLNPAESGKGYISVSFTTNTNSSRAVDDTNNGDKDGNADDSGHHMAGTEDENKVNSVLIYGIGKNNDAHNFSVYYDNLSATGTDKPVTVSGQTLTSKAMEVEIDEYEVNVIVNPSTQVLNKSPKEIKDYVFSGAVDNEAAIDAVTKSSGASKRDNFMMAGKKAETIEVTEANSTEATAANNDNHAVEVERVVAKIAIRSITPEGGAVNVYPVKVTVKSYNEETKATTVTESTWYMKLEKYALVNLSKQNYAVRHTTNDNFATVTAANGAIATGDNAYLVDPQSITKSSLTINDAFNGGTYFFNSLYDLTDATFNNDVTKLGTFFSTMPDGTKNESGTVNSAHGTIDYIGTPVSYAFENAVTAAKQVIGLSTGIVFQAQIYEDKECTKSLTSDLYKYAGNYYTDLMSLSTAYKDDPVYGLNEDDSTDPVTYTSKLEGKTNAELELLGISRYKGGVCYYYTSQIKHFDNNDNTSMGNMEFAIMRNNIYSIAVESISEIGASSLKPYKPGDKDEEPKTYIKVRATILPWIVRFNNIKF